jgi:maltose/maltodextrin transport system substrate-binding protein/arabinogalactan oligomer/maltooligosaccharide transport system substrate-binding protein
MRRNKFVLVLVLSALMAVLSIGVMAQEADPLLIWADGERAPLLTELGAQFEAEFGIPVEVQEVGLGDARDQLLVVGPTGEGPDILIIAHDSIGVLAANGAILPLDLGEQAADFYPAALNLFTYNGELWGIPYATENIALVRNVDLVPEAPTTWQEVRAISEALQADGSAEFGYLVQTGDAYHNFPIFSAFGGYIFGQNEDGTFNVADVGYNSEGGLAAGAWLEGMYTDGLMVPDVNDDVIFEKFTSGDLAMFATGPWNSARIVETGINYSIDPLPGAEGGAEVGAPFAGGQGFVVSAFSDKVIDAEAFLYDFVATTEFMQQIFDQGGRPAAFASVDTSADANIASFIAAGATAIPMPAIPQMGAVWGAAGSALTAISTGSESATALNDAVEQINTAIGLMDGETRLFTLPGSFNEEVGCPGDWQPECPATELVANEDGTFGITLDIPAGSYEFKVAVNYAWGENYGADGVKDGPNVVLELAADSKVTFVYDDTTNVVTFTAE